MVLAPTAKQVLSPMALHGNIMITELTRERHGETTTFSDAAWASGNAQLGYGDGDETTVVSYGSNANDKYVTTYFRKTISIGNPLAFSSFAGNVRRDDGVIIYVNGNEVYRKNMPAGTITYTTLASTNATDDGNTAQNFTISSSSFVSGNNVIA